MTAISKETASVENASNNFLLKQQYANSVNTLSVANT